MNERLKEFFRYTDSSGLKNIHSYYSYIKQPEKIKTLKEVKEYDIKATSEMEYLQELIEIIKLYRAELYNRFQEINSAEYHSRLTIQRYKKLFPDRVFFEITLESVPNRADVAPIEIFAELYNGKERHKALKRFAELCKEYPHAEIIKKVEKSQWEK